MFPALALNRAVSNRTARPLLALAVLIFPGWALAQQPMWSGDLTLTIKGEGEIKRPYPKIGGVKITWSVNRFAKGRVVLDRPYRGASIRGSPDSYNKERYETWVGNYALPVEEMRVDDIGTYYGPIPGAGLAVVLDTQRYKCPGPTPGRADDYGFRTSILQFDYDQGTYTWEVPRIYAVACEKSFIRVPKLGKPEFMKNEPWEIGHDSSGQVFMTTQLESEEGWSHITGPFKKGDTEIVLTRTFKLSWMNSLGNPAAKAPVTAELVLVLRKTP
jgi:hypothetical protein